MHAKFIAAILFAGYLGLHNGYLTLWDHTGTDPEIIFPYRAESYSAADQVALERGIPYHTRTELNRLLEDYLS